MTSVLLDRVGIVLTFIAGFLLAPQLIGLDRIRRVERWAERGSAEVNATAHRQATALRNTWASRAKRESTPAWDGADILEGPDSPASALGFMAVGLAGLIPVAGAVALLDWLLDIDGLSSWWSLAVAIGLVCVLPAVVAAIIEHSSLTDSRLGRIVWPLAWVGFSLRLVWLMLAFSLFGLAEQGLYLAARVAGAAASALLHALSGDDRLLGGLTTLGVLTFIAGSACQFSATFQ
jgi:hypothetical protein